MRTLINKINKKGAMFWGQTLMMFAAVMSIGMPVQATVVMPDLVRDVLGAVVGAMQVLGASVAVFGGVQFALSFKNDDADAKGKGLRAFLAGGMSFAFASAGRVFLRNVIP